MKATLRVSLVALALLSLACADDKTTSLPTSPVGVMPNQLSAYVTVSNARPNVGDEVTVGVRALRGSAVGPIGSFTIRLTYDSVGLTFLQADRSANGMVMTNARTAGTLVAAGASAKGFADDQLVSATFRVNAANALSTLSLKVQELNGSGFEDRRSATRVERQLYRAK
jgi:hypothetical protein